MTRHAAAAELYIDRGSGADGKNLLVFDALHADKDSIERLYGGPLEWLRLEISGPAGSSTASTLAVTVTRTAGRRSRTRF